MVSHNPHSFWVSSQRGPLDSHSELSKNRIWSLSHFVSSWMAFSHAWALTSSVGQEGKEGVLTDRVASPLPHDAGGS